MINQVTLVGRLTKDPDLRTTADGTPVTQVNLAVSRNFRNHNGEIEADFITCTLWRNAAENTFKYCRKGSVVGVTGRLQSRHYDNREGRRVYVTDVVAETIRFLSSKPNGANAGQHSEVQSGARQQTQVFHEEQHAPERPLQSASAEYPPPQPAPGTNGQQVSNGDQVQVPIIQQEERKEEVSVAF